MLHALIRRLLYSPPRGIAVVGIPNRSNDAAVVSKLNEGMAYTGIRVELSSNDILTKTESF